MPNRKGKNSSRRSHQKLSKTKKNIGGGNFRVGMEEVIKAILRAMKTHVNTIEVCYNGFCALRNITSNNGKHITVEFCPF